MEPITFLIVHSVRLGRHWILKPTSASPPVSLFWSVCPSIRLSVCLSVCLSVSVFSVSYVREGGHKHVYVHVFVWVSSIVTWMQFTAFSWSDIATTFFFVPLVFVWLLIQEWYVFFASPWISAMAGDDTATWNQFIIHWIDIPLCGR